MSKLNSKFLAECHGIPVAVAERFALFMPCSLPAFSNPQVWVKGDMARLYLDVWSQNKMPAIVGLKKCYVRPDGMIAFTLDGSRGMSSITLEEVSLLQNSWFSGSRTRQKLIDSWAMYYEKTNRH